MINHKMNNYESNGFTEHKINYMCNKYNVYRIYNVNSFHLTNYHDATINRRIYVKRKR